MVRFLHITVVATFLVSSALPAAEAATACQLQDRWDFSSGLDANAVTNGTATFDSNRLCATVGGPLQLQDVAGSFDYDGSCAIATLTASSMSGVIIGGSVIVTDTDATPGHVRLVVLVPNQVCNEDYGTGVGALVVP